MDGCMTEVTGGMPGGYRCRRGQGCLGGGIGKVGWQNGQKERTQAVGLGPECVIYLPACTSLEGVVVLKGDALDAEDWCCEF